MEILDKIKSLTKQLYPTGRVFKMPVGGFFEKLHNGLAESENRAYEDAVSILDSALPDNDKFTSADASSWEKRLGLITNTSVSLDDRKLSIIRKMAHPGSVKGRQHYLYLQGQLQAAGFDLNVYENRYTNNGLVDPINPGGLINTSNWISRTSAADNTWNSVTYGNGLFVAVASSGTGNRVMTSPDGITWTARTSAADNNWTSVTYGNGLFVAVANSGTGNRA